MTAMTSSYNNTNSNMNMNSSMMMQMMQPHHSGTITPPQYESSSTGSTRTDTLMPLQSFGPTNTIPHKPSLVPLVANSRGGSKSNSNIDRNNNSKTTEMAATTVNSNSEESAPAVSTAADGTIRVPSGSGYRIMTPFPWRLHEMLEEIEAKKMGWIVSWLPGGRAFQVHSPEKFSEDVIPKFFRHTRYKSFQRQLYLYGFRSLEVSSLSRGAYFHPFFVRENRSLCRFIERPKSTSGKSSDSSPSEKPEKRKRSRKSTKKDTAAPKTKEPAQPIMVQAVSEGNDSGPLYTSSGLPTMRQTFSNQSPKCDNLTMDLPSQLQLDPIQPSSATWGNPNTVSLDGSTTRSSSTSIDMFSNDSNDDEPLFMERFEERFDWGDLSVADNIEVDSISTTNDPFTPNRSALLQRLEPFSDDIINLFGRSHFVPQTIG